MMDPTTAMRQAHETAGVYARRTLDDLLTMLDINPQRDPKWREKLAPFAPVWASMIAASERDFANSHRVGQVQL